MTTMNVYIYPNTEAEDDLAWGAWSAANEALNEVVNDWRFDGENVDYSVDIKWEYPDLDDPTKDEFYDKFTWWTWLEASGDGVHLGLSSNWGGGAATTGEGAIEGTAWDGETEAVAGQIDGDATDFFQAVVVQEIFHPFIDKALSDMESMLGPSGNEHTLGRINSLNEVTPMATSYVDDGYDDEGLCDSQGYYYTETTSPTWCTMEALYVTYDAAVR